MSFHPGVRRAFKDLIAQGWIDALRKLHPDETIYTFGITFVTHTAGMQDYVYTTSIKQKIAKRLIKCEVDKEVRGWEKTSDHAPVWILSSERLL